MSLGSGLVHAWEVSGDQNNEVQDRDLGLCFDQEPIFFDGQVVVEAFMTHPGTNTSK